MRSISARFVPWLLSEDQKALCVFVCRELKQQARDDPNFICSDETQVYDYDPETKQQSSQWNSPSSLRLKKARQVRTNVNSVLIIFSTSKALSIRNSYPLVKPSMAGFTVRFWSSWGREFCTNTDKSKKNYWFLHHVNAPAHTSVIVRQFLTSKNITVISHCLFTWPCLL
jgi:hypothetical protein